MNSTCRITLVAALFALAQGAFAHDPAEHAKEAAEAKKGPDCSAMDHSKMDMKDPVQQALMAKCSKAAPSAQQQDMKGMDMKGMKMDAPAADTKKPKAHSDNHEGH